MKVILKVCPIQIVYQIAYRNSFVWLEKLY